MTKTRLLWLTVVPVALLNLLVGAGLALAADRGSAKLTIHGAHITIDYGRPELRGRDMMAQIKPGQVWRIGANAPTTLETDKELNFGGTVVPKGKHILLARLDEPGKWSLVFSTKSNFDYEPSAKIAEVPLTFEQASDSAELVTITLADKDGAGVVEIAWGKMRLSASFKVG
jgi:hypothetical protein